MKMEVHKVPGDLKLIGVRKKSLNWNLSASRKKWRSKNTTLNFSRTKMQKNALQVLMLRYVECSVHYFTLEARFGLQLNNNYLITFKQKEKNVFRIPKNVYLHRNNKESEKLGNAAFIN